MKIRSMNGVKLPKDFNWFLRRNLQYVDDWEEAYQLARLDYAEYLALQEPK